MCTCIKKIEEKTQNKHNAVFAQFDHFGHQSSEIRYKPFKKDGKPSQVVRYDSKDWKYCPFCGCLI